MSEITHYVIDDHLDTITHYVIQGHLAAITYYVIEDHLAAINNPRPWWKTPLALLSVRVTFRRC